MPSYVPNTEEDRRTLLSALGIPSLEDLFFDIPADLRNPGLRLPSGLSELELQREMARLAGRNRAVDQMPCFLGAGAYRHFIPSVVGALASRGEFATAYTPYQPEISQGTLQAIFEFQSAMCHLTGMDVANSGMYDGATALAEAALMACRLTGRNKVAILSTVAPAWRGVVETYAEGPEVQIALMSPEGAKGGMQAAGAASGPTALSTVAAAFDESYGCLVVQYPNFFGYLEDIERWAVLAHENGALLVVAAGLVPLGLLKPPGELGADIVVAEGQPLGQSTTFGGPYVGIFCARAQYVRQMPGRIVGRTSDGQGRTGYVLTLQAREQHIRRERATSNICTSQALVALMNTIYLAALGPHGLREVAEQCYHKAHYLAAHLAKLPGYTLPLKGEFFHEFVVRCPEDPPAVNRRLLDAGIMGGLDVSEWIENGMLLCCTEVNTRSDIDRLVDELRGMGLEA